MTKPKLEPAAAKFYRQHHDRLVKAGLLTPATEDAFVLLCKTYGHLMTLDPNDDPKGWIRHFALLKSYQTYARGFAMSSDKPRTAQADGEVDAFGI